MIDATNFCHIEEMPDGRKVLFFATCEDDKGVVRIVTYGDVGTLTETMTGECDVIERLWGDTLNFTEAAKLILAKIDCFCAPIQ